MSALRQPPPMALSAGRRLGPYEIVAPLGAGGMGEVYRARDPRLGRDVAIKVLPGEPYRPIPNVFAASSRKRARPRRSTIPIILAVYDVGTTTAPRTSSPSCSKARRCASGCGRRPAGAQGCRVRRADRARPRSGARAGASSIAT